jgi:membrane associated rhomboid family serine protease
MIPIHDDNPSRHPPFVTVGLIVPCVLVFLWQLAQGPAIQQTVVHYGATPAYLFGFEQYPQVAFPVWATAFTSMFLHGGWLHLIGNMLYLWIFGNNVEDSVGHVKFLVFYLLCGLIALLGNAIPNMESEVPMIGASGAIAGVLGAYLLLFPHARVLMLIPLGFFFYTVFIPAGVVLVIWFALQILSSAMHAGEQGGVAWGAHIGGFVSGMVLILFMRKPGIRLFQRARRRY